MPTDPPPANPLHDENWRGDFQSMRDRLRDASLAATPSQRLQWLEDAIAFAAKMGALPRRDNEEPSPRDHGPGETSSPEPTPPRT